MSREFRITLTPKLVHNSTDYPSHHSCHSDCHSQPRSHAALSLAGFCFSTCNRNKKKKTNHKVRKVATSFTLTLTSALCSTKERSARLLSLRCVRTPSSMSEHPLALITPSGLSSDGLGITLWRAVVVAVAAAAGFTVRCGSRQLSWAAAVAGLLVWAYR
jgi:hypothetical protein